MEEEGGEIDRDGKEGRGGRNGWSSENKSIWDHGFDVCCGHVWGASSPCGDVYFVKVDLLVVSYQAGLYFNAATTSLWAVCLLGESLIEACVYEKEREM